MGLLDYLDPDEFGTSGGLFGRLFPEAQAGGDTSLPPNVSGGVAQPFASPASTSFGAWPFLGQSPITQPRPAPSQAGITPAAYAQANPPASDVHTQYQALRPILGDRDAMLAIVHPEAAPTLLAQAQANPPTSGNASGVVQAGYRLGIPFPPIPMPPGPFPVPPIPAPAIPDWWKAVGPILQLFPRISSGTGGGDGGATGVIAKRKFEELAKYARTLLRMAGRATML